MITVISVLGVAAGVMALVIALAVTNGFRNTLQRNLLGAMAHIDVLAKQPLNGIENWRRYGRPPAQGAARHGGLAGALRTGLPHRLRYNSHAGVVKGIDVDSELAISETLRHLKAGSLDRPARLPTAPSRASSWATAWWRIPAWC